MMKRTVMLACAIVLLLSATAFTTVGYAEEQKVWSRKYTSMNVEIYAPIQCYPEQIITVKINVKPLENIKNISITILIWSTKSEGHEPWIASFFALVTPNLSVSEVRNETYGVGIPSDISPGLTYGTVSLEWSIYREPSWEDQWDKGNFRMTYVKNKDYENLQSDLQNTRTLMYAFLATTITLAISTAYLARKSRK